MSRHKPEAFIDQWSVIRFDGRQHLVGKITHHPNQSTFLKTFQMTSPIILLHTSANWAETENTVYTLKERSSYEDFDLFDSVQPPDGGDG